jgi:hypothetical protein
VKASGGSLTIWADKAWDDVSGETATTNISLIVLQGLQGNKVELVDVHHGWSVSISLATRDGSPVENHEVVLTHVEQSDHVKISIKGGGIFAYSEVGGQQTPFQHWWRAHYQDPRSDGELYEHIGNIKLVDAGAGRTYNYTCKPGGYCEIDFCSRD